MAEKFIVGLPEKTIPENADILILEDGVATKRINYQNLVGAHKAESASDDVHDLLSGGKIIEESGSNDNGRYTRFSDGTQICHNGYLPSSNNETSGVIITLPASFSNIAYSVNASARGMISGVTSSSYVVESIPDSTSTIRVKILVHGSTDIFAPEGTTFGYTAVGRWK